MVNYNAANVALYQLGASGSNAIPDGYVRTTEKVWIDSYVYSTASTANMTTGDTLIIGYIPAGKKIIGCEVYFPTTFAPVTCLINVGPSYSTSLLISSATVNVTAVTAGSLNYNKVSMNNPAGFAFVCTSSTTAVSGGTILQNVNTPIYLSFSGVALTTPTSGTISTILRYT